MFRQQYDKIVLSALISLLAISCGYSQSNETRVIDFGKFNEDDWIKVRDEAVPDIGSFIQKEGCIMNFVKEKDKNSSALSAGHAMRFLKGVEFLNGRIEAEIELVGRAAPSIYFRTQATGDVHQAAYNLVVFDFSSADNPYYYGFNLWKWQETWPPEAKASKHWLKLASWAFPVPLNKKFKIAVECKGPYINVFFDGQLKGSVYDPDSLGKGAVGICSCEGQNLFYNFKMNLSK